MHHFCQWRWKDTRADSGAAEDVSKCIPGSMGVGPVEDFLVGVLGPGSWSYNTYTTESATAALKCD